MYGANPYRNKPGEIPQESWALQSVKNGKRRGGIVGASGYRSKIIPLGEFSPGGNHKMIMEGLGNGYYGY